ncbi:hypothetical protein P7K49_039050, partial [Saguinus oedipus]
MVPNLPEPEDGMHPRSLRGAQLTLPAVAPGALPGSSERRSACDWHLLPPDSWLASDLSPDLSTKSATTT